MTAYVDPWMALVWISIAITVIATITRTIWQRRRP